MDTAQREVRGQMKKHLRTSLALLFAIVTACIAEP